MPKNIAIITTQTSAISTSVAPSSAFAARASFNRIKYFRISSITLPCLLV